jgi:hypothetical protein
METRSPHVDDCGFDYMANTGQEAKDRDTVGMVLAIVVIAFLTFSQYMNWY